MNDKPITVLIEQFEATLGFGQQAINALTEFLEKTTSKRLRLKSKSAHRITAQIFAATVHFAARLHGELHTCEIAVFVEHEFTKSPKHIMSAVIDASGTLQFRNNPVPVEDCAAPVLKGVLMALRNGGYLFGDSLAQEAS